MWATLTTGPRLIFKATGRFELTLRTDGDEIITIEFGEREQVVIRERLIVELIVEPWDVDCVVAAVDGGACCLPAGHHGGHDSDPAYDGAVPERIDDESVGDGGDLAAPVAVA
jgi:hypothetical protein